MGDLRKCAYWNMKNNIGEDEEEAYKLLINCEEWVKPECACPREINPIYMSVQLIVVVTIFA